MKRLTGNGSATPGPGTVGPPAACGATVAPSSHAAGTTCMETSPDAGQKVRVKRENKMCKRTKYTRIVAVTVGQAAGGCRRVGSAGAPSTSSAQHEQFRMRASLALKQKHVALWPRLENA